MTNKEAIDTIKLAKAEIEWNYSLDYQVAFDMAIKALEKELSYNSIKTELDELKADKVIKMRDITPEEMELVGKYIKSMNNLTVINSREPTDGWLKKAEEEVLSMPKQNIDWSKIKELTEIAITNKKDIVITINADGSKEIEISTPTTSIVETQMRTRYVPEGMGE